MKRRALAIIAAVLLVGLAAASFVFAFGTPQAPPPGPAGTSADKAASPDGKASASVAASAQVPQPDPASPLAVEIPGCTCHSDDPALVEEHAGYRMNQCFGCHNGGTPGIPGSQ
jgi:hypothetical protein